MYTFRRFPLYDAIDKIAALGVSAIEPAFFLKLDGGRVILNPFKLTLNGAPVNSTVALDLGVPGIVMRETNRVSIDLSGFFKAVSGKLVELVETTISRAGNEANTEELIRQSQPNGLKTGSTSRPENHTISSLSARTSLARRSLTCTRTTASLAITRPITAWARPPTRAGRSP
jgi:hypothetical protein